MVRSQTRPAADMTSIMNTFSCLFRPFAWAARLEKRASVALCICRWLPFAALAHNANSYFVTEACE